MFTYLLFNISFINLSILEFFTNLNYPLYFTSVGRIRSELEKRDPDMIISVHPLCQVPILASINYLNKKRMGKQFLISLSNLASSSFFPSLFLYFFL